MSDGLLTLLAGSPLLMAAAVAYMTYRVHRLECKVDRMRDAMIAAGLLKVGHL